MKIDSTYKPSAPPVSSRQTQRAPNPGLAAAEAVNLSAVAGSLQGKDKPPINAARIEEIKTAIAQGRFKVDPEAIASNLIETARSLVNSQRKG